MPHTWNRLVKKLLTPDILVLMLHTPNIIVKVLYTLKKQKKRYFKYYKYLLNFIILMEKFLKVLFYTSCSMSLFLNYKKKIILVLLNI